MASEEDLDLKPEDEEPTASSNKKIIIIAAIVILLGGGAAAFFLMGGGSADDKVDVKAVEEVSEESTNPVKGEAVYVSIPGGILAQIQTGRRKLTLQVQIDMLIRKADDEELILKHMPLIENDLLMLFSSADADELKTPQGKKDIRQRSLEIIQGIMKQQTGREVVEAVLFTGFVMQR